MNNSLFFLDEIVAGISKADQLHSKKVRTNVAVIREEYPEEFSELLSLIVKYFHGLGIENEKVTSDYLRMIKDMRREGLYFYKNGRYRCENQEAANIAVYSKPEIMSYYMHALLISQILWAHHFQMFIFFGNQVKELSLNGSVANVLDVGPGHGFFSFIVQKQIPQYSNIDVVDISATSLHMTQTILGNDNGKIQYHLQNIFDFDGTKKYDLILLGEVIEHLDDPKGILIKLGSLLSKNGVLWVTTPTNSPAMDHVYLFNSRVEVFNLIHDAGLEIVETCNFFAEDVDEETAQKNRVTDLVGLFCKKS